jgi:hypothetical protein
MVTAQRQAVADDRGAPMTQAVSEPRGSTLTAVPFADDRTRDAAQWDHPDAATMAS